MPVEDKAAIRVLSDYLLDHGVPSWLTEFATHQAFVYNTLKTAKCKCSGQNVSARKRARNAHHEPSCTLGQLLRAIGGEAEIKLQCHLGHEQALREGSEYWRRYWTQGMSDAVARLRQGEHQPGHRTAHDPASFDPQVLTGLRHAGVLEIERHRGFIRIPRSLNACGTCIAVGPMPHYPGCPGTR